MNTYRINKINGQKKTLVKENLKTESEADDYAKAASLKDVNNSYEVQKKDENAEDHDYFTTNIFHHGALVVEIDDIKRSR